MKIKTVCIGLMIFSAIGVILIAPSIIKKDAVAVARFCYAIGWMAGVGAILLVK